MKKILGIMFCILLVTSTGFVMGINTRDRVSSEEPMMATIVDEWPMFRHDLYNTGYSTSSAPDDNGVLWSKYIGDWVDSKPTIKDGKLYIAGDNYWQQGGTDVWCLNPFTGDEIWRTNLPDDFIWGAPTVANDRVYVLGTYFYLYCLDANTGTILWTFQAYGSCSPMVVDDKVYFGCSPGAKEGFYCLNATTGDEIWVFEEGSFPGCTPAIANGKVYIGNHDLYCLDAETGDEIWSSSNKCEKGSPVVFNNKVYTNFNQVYCLDADNGDVLWTYPIGSYHSSPAVAYGNVYVPTGDYGPGIVYALDADTGALVWSSPQLPPIRNDATVADDKIYINSGSTSSLSKFVCLDAYTGTIIWEYELGGMHYMYSSAAVAYGTVYVGAGENGYIYAFGTPNEPPETPTEPDGPTEGNVGVEYTFTSSTTDPEGDDIYYLFDWGDETQSEWLGPYPSGDTVDASHSWNEGEYEIKVKAKDSITGIETDWSPAHTITIMEGPILQIGAISGGIFKIKAIIKNVGGAEAVNVNWSITLNGGLIILGKESSGTIDSIPAGGEVQISSDFLIALGKTTITVTAEIPESIATRETEATILLFLILVNPSGS